MKLHHYWVWIFLLSAASLIHGQEQVYVLAAMEGQGYLRERNGKCFVITPFHVVSGSAGSLEIIGSYGLKATAKIARGYEIADLAVLELTSGKLECSKWLEMTNFDLMLSTQSGGHLSFREKNGSIIPMEVDFIDVTEDYITIRSAESDQMLNEGMSGGTLLVNGAPSGMLLNVDTETGIGSVIRRDAIMRLTAPFFETPKTKADLDMESKNQLAKNIFSFPVIRNQFMINPSMLKIQAEGKVAKISFGYSPEHLNKTINVQKLLDASLTSLFFLPVKPGVSEVWYQVEFVDGTLSGINSYHIKDTQEYKGVEIPSLKKQSAPSLYLLATQLGYPSLFLQWEVPLEATATLYSFDDGGYFKLDKLKSKSINVLPIKPTTDYIRLVFEFSNGKQTEPFEYQIDGIDNLILNTIKDQLENGWEDYIECYQVPDLTSKNEELKSKIEKRVAQLGFKNQDSSPGVLCKLNNGIEPYLLTSLKEFRIGTIPSQLNTKVPIDLNFQLLQNEGISRLSHEPFLNRKITGSGNEIYFQLKYFDDSLSDIKRIPVKSLF